MSSSLTTSQPLTTGFQQHPPPPQQRPNSAIHPSALPRAYAFQPGPSPSVPAPSEPYFFKTEPASPPLQPYLAPAPHFYQPLPYTHPQRPHSSHTYPTQYRFGMSSPDRASQGDPAQGYQQPMTPLSGDYPAPAPVSQYYGVAGSGQPMPSPPSSGRPTSANFTPDGLPIVPVGISGGKMFRCKGFGDCDKVFTRSEHLARHVRKHTGERPFPCHCGKAFSRLDNLRQHAATVHAEQASRNEQMLNELSAVHAALSQKANKEQRKRGEIVEVPKNAVERPRTTEVNHRTKRSDSMGQSQGPMGPQPPYPYPPPGTGDSQSSVAGHGGWGMPAGSRPRTGGGWDYPQQYAGPSNGSEHPDDRRPSSSASAMGGQFSGYQPYYPPNSDNRGPPPQSSSGEPVSQLPYPFRPISSQGRELPVPAHYAEDAAQQGPPGSGWQSPQSAPPFGPAGPSSHEGSHMYPPQESHGSAPYPPEQYASGNSHGYYYPPPPQQQQPGYYGSSQYPSSGPPPPPSQSQQPHYPPVYQGQGSQGPSHEPPYAYSGSNPQYPPYQYEQPQGQGQSQGRKRRAEDAADDDAHRAKHTRSQEDLRAGPAGLHPSSAEGGPGPRDPNWLPPTNERRSSLAISALLGSPTEAHRSRPNSSQVPEPAAPQPYLQAYQFGRVDGDAPAPAPAAVPAATATAASTSPVLTKPAPSQDSKHGLVNDMDAKAKALLDLGQPVPEAVAN